MTKFKLPFLFLLIFLGSCTNSKPETSFLEQKISNEEKIEKLLSFDLMTATGIDSSGRQLLYDFYKARKFKPVWCDKTALNEKGTLLFKMLQQPVVFGISPKRFKGLKWSKKYPVENDIIISCMLARMYPDLKYGMVDSTRKQLKPIQYASLQQLDTLFDIPSDESALVEKIILWGPADTTYQLLARGLYQFSKENDLNAVPVKVTSNKIDSTAAIEQSKAALVARHYLEANNTDDEIYISALKKFQRENGHTADGIVGEYTAKALEESNLHKCERIALAMEKWRWKTSFPKRFIWINIPEYKLRFFDNDTLKSINNVVVGKFKNQTPELQSKLRSIVVYPYWNVPYSITSKEMLPELKKNPNYLERNKMVLLKKGEPIDPHTINWKKIKENTFPYNVRQEPGPHNSLGILKFEFYNKYDVYLHDTPSKGLFKTDVRSYSHGCVRCEHPVELAKLILEIDKNKITADSLDTLFARKENFPVQIKTPFPIYLDYITVIPNAKNGLIVLRDIYLKDEDFLKFMF